MRDLIDEYWRAVAVMCAVWAFGLVVIAALYYGTTWSF